MTRSVVVIDNHDSFTFNLVEGLRRLGAEVKVLRNTVPAAVALGEAEARDALLLLSPGPGGPEDAGCCLEVIARAQGHLAVVGICLGHQAIALHAGGRIGSADAPVHGKACDLQHDGRGPFANLPSPMRVARYHSLAARDLPQRFSIHAAIGDMVMAFSDPVAKQVGLQFHPESILTTYGDRLLANILVMA